MGFLVGAGARRRTGRQVELAAVDVDVALEPRDSELRRQSADEFAEVGERLAHSLRPAVCKESFDSRELQKSHRYLPVLGLAGREPLVGPKRGGHVRLELEARILRGLRFDDRRSGHIRVRVEPEQRRAASFAGRPLGPIASAVPGLTRTSPAPAASSSWIVSVAAGPATTSSRWLDPTRKNGRSPRRSRSPC